MAEEMMFQIAKSVTRPVLRIEPGKPPVRFKVTGPIVQAKATAAGREKKDASGNVLPPPEIMPVVDYATGEEATVVVNMVLGSELRENYPNDGYVGKWFQVAKIAPDGNKRYATFDIKEGNVVSKDAQAKPVAATAKPVPATAKK